MKKETLIAIIFGIILGSILGIIIFENNRKQQLEKSKIITPREKSLLPTPKTTNLQLLEITQLQNMTVVSENKVIIQGKANKDSLIVIQSPLKDLVFKNEQSEFKKEFPLALGENVIKIVVYPKEFQFRLQEKQLKIYYLPEEL